MGRVFVGHTPQWGSLKRLGNVYAVDTGAIFSEILDGHAGHLTCVEMVSRTMDLDARPSVPCGGVDVALAPGEGPAVPFGAYAASRLPPTR